MNLSLSPAQMNDADLRSGLAEAYEELKQVANKDPNSEWHDCCFAACMVFAMEMNRRGLKHEAQDAYAGLVEHDIMEREPPVNSRGLGSLFADKDRT